MIVEIDNLIERGEKFFAESDQILLDIVKKHQIFILEMNVDDQLYNGIDANGEEMFPPYAESTKRKKRKKGDPVDRVTLLDEGVFYDSFFIEFGSDQFTILSDDNKQVYLIGKYGEDIFGLTKENLKRLTDLIEPEYLLEFQKRVFE